MKYTCSRCGFESETADGMVEQNGNYYCYSGSNDTIGNCAVWCAMCQRYEPIDQIESIEMKHYTYLEEYDGWCCHESLKRNDEVKQCSYCGKYDFVDCIEQYNGLCRKCGNDSYIRANARYRRI